VPAPLHRHQLAIRILMIAHAASIEHMPFVNVIDPRSIDLQPDRRAEERATDPGAT